MLQLAIEETGENRLEVLDWELESAAPSYTLCTVKRLMKHENSPVTLLMGNEVFKGLPRWHEPERLLGMCDFVVVMREGALGFDPKSILEACGVRDIASEGQARTRHHRASRWVDRMDMVALPVSATKVRESLTTFSRESPSTPQGISRSVWQYIKEKRLYTVTKE